MHRIIAYMLVVLAFAAPGFAAQSFHDNFGAYQDGFTGEPAWNASSVNWEMRGGAFRCTSPDRAFAIYAPAPYADEQVVEATVTLSGTTTNQWKIAGLVVYQDTGNYWHLALVESPNADGSRHFVELVEAYDGAWLSENAPRTKLTTIAHSGGDFAWLYDHPYRLRLHLTKDAIEGTVSEIGGDVVSRIAYRLDNPRSVRAGYAGLDGAGFDAAFDDFRLEATSTVKPPQKPSPPPVKVESWSGGRAAPTGFFRVGQVDGRWWFFDPNGRAFYVIGTDHANYNVHWCEALGYAPYHRNMVEKFGSEEAWAKSTVARLRAWGFNTVAANNSPSLRHQGLAHIEFVSFGASFASSDDICPRVNWTGFPNVFSPKWRQHCRKLARQSCAPLKDDPWLIGYFLDNELEWYGKSWRPWGLADEAFKKPANHTAKIALIQFLRKRYRDDIAVFNRAWGTRVSSFDALLARRRPIGQSSDAARADKMAFVRIIAERYFSACSAALREFDPNHLNLGCRFAGQAPDVWDIAGTHCDVVTVNCYRQADLDRRTIIGFEDDLRRWHEAARRPLMITEWSFPALDSGLPCAHGAGQRFDTQEQRAAAWRIFQELLFRTPYLVGSDYFMWVDEPALGISKTFPEDTNYGLVNERDEPYVTLTEVASKVNPTVYRLHAGRVAELRPVLSETPPRLRIHNDGRAGAEVVARIWTDGTPQNVTVRVRAGGETEVPWLAPTAPGAHYVQCMVDPDGAVPEGNRSDNEAHAAWYVPGLPWSDDTTHERAPVIIANPTNVDLSSAIVSVAITPQPRGATAWTPGAGWLPSVYDAERKQVRLTVPGLRAHSAIAVLLYPGGAGRPVSAAVTAQAPAFVLVPAQQGNEEAAVLMMGDERVGHLLPVIWQKTPADEWVRPSLETCVTRHVGAALEVTATMHHAGTNTGGVIGPSDKPEARLNAPRAFRCGYSMKWVRGRDWFTARLDWLRGADAQPWECPAYFHYLLPDFTADAGGPGVPSYYRPFAGWWDEQRKIGIGALALAPDDFTLDFWKDERGATHADAYRTINLRVAKGTTYTEPQPEIVIFATRGKSLRETSLGIWTEARAERRLETHVSPTERRRQR
jgi:hypothetical protein